MKDISSGPSATGATRCLLRCRNLEIGYRGRALVPAVNLDVKAGEVLLVVGRNGAGKSTWLKTVLGLVPPVAGTVELGTPAPRVTYIAQAAGIDPMLPIRASRMVAWGRLRGWGFLRPLASKADRTLCNDAMKTAEADAFAKQPFRDLSGGQKQRVLFSRLLASEAELALLDEPTAALDTTSERDAYRRLGSLAHDDGLGIIIVTHTLGVAAQYADKILLLDAGEQKGRGISAYGAPDEIFAHATFRRHFDEHLPTTTSATESHP